MRSVLAIPALALVLLWIGSILGCSNSTTGSRADGGAQIDGGGNGGGGGGGGSGNGGGGGGGGNGPGSDGGTSGDLGSGGGDGGTSGGSEILVPAQGALLGHFYGAGTIAATDARIGRKPAVVLNYFGWEDDWTTEKSVTDDFADHRIPLVNWEPGTDTNKVDFQQIIDGKFDTMLKARALGAKKLGQKFFLDFAAEMNGEEGWGGNNPARYIGAWRHIHDLFVQNGATNVIWVWAPNVTDIDGGPATMEYYPGDSYVDWTGVDGYNWGTSDKNFVWQSFHDVFIDIYAKLAAKGKPIMIGEMASDEVGGSKAQWIGDIAGTLKKDFPAIKCFVWFDIDKERHWLINSSTTAQAAYATMAQDPYLNP
jgi:glycosyl hydrolase family 26